MAYIAVCKDTGKLVKGSKYQRVFGTVASLKKSIIHDRSFPIDIEIRKIDDQTLIDSSDYVEDFHFSGKRGKR